VLIAVLVTTTLFDVISGRIRRERLQHEQTATAKRGAATDIKLTTNNLQQAKNSN
jgi:hypothetical protein